jgi:hypothetical protein
LHARERVGLGDAFFDYSEYHRNATPRKFGEKPFGVLVESYNRPVRRYFF